MIRYDLIKAEILIELAKVMAELSLKSDRTTLKNTGAEISVTSGKRAYEILAKEEIEPSKPLVEAQIAP